MILGQQSTCHVAKVQEICNYTESLLVPLGPLKFVSAVCLMEMVQVVRKETGQPLGPSSTLQEKMKINYKRL